MAGRFNHRAVLGDSLRRFRKQRRLTQEGLGELAGLNPKYLGEVERREKTISVDALARLADALGVTLADFFTEADQDSKG